MTNSIRTTLIDCMRSKSDFDYNWSEWTPYRWADWDSIDPITLDRYMKSKSTKAEVIHNKRNPR